MIPSAGGPEVPTDASLGWRDWLLLPLIGILTIVLLTGLTELVAQREFARSKTGIGRCMVLDDPTTGARGIPNSVCWEKVPETALIEYRFNSCGHRAGMECGPKPAGTYRIVMIGSSVAFGHHVQQEQSFAALLPRELTQLAGRRVELYNEGGFMPSHSSALRFKEVLDAQPDLILWVLTPNDIRGLAEVLRGHPDPGAGLSFLRRNLRRLRVALAGGSIEGAAAELFSHSMSAYMLRHFLYQSQSETVAALLRGRDSEVKAELSAAWQSALKQFEKDADIVEGRARAAGVPFAAVFIPGRAQSAMISMGEWPAGYDPYKLNDHLRSIIKSHGGVYIDILPDYRDLPNPERLYLAMDGHPNVKGNAVIASMLARELSSGAIPALRMTARAQALIKPGI